MKLSNSLDKNSIVMSNIKFFVLPFLFTFLIIITFLLSVNFSVKKISSQRKSLGSLKVMENELGEKVDFYDSVKTQIPDYIKTLSYAYPEKNSSLLVISQLKRAQAELGVIISGLKVSSSSSGKNQDGMVKVGFVLTTTMEQFYPFITRIISFSPIISIDKIIMDVSGENFEVTMSLTSQFGTIPDKMPNSPALVKMNDSDLLLYDEMKSLEAPSIFSLPVQENPGRVNPF